MFGDKEIAPFGVYDDGKWTYFDFRKHFISNRLPVAYKVIDKYDSIVNVRVENGFLIAESLSPEGWTLKNGKKTICIRPKDNLLELYKPSEELKISTWSKIKNLF
jgi:type IV secretory pathway VirB9-like protein